MLAIYALRDQRLVTLDTGDEPPADAVWLDLFEPTQAEEQVVERLLGLNVPTREEMAEIELSSRLYREDQAIFMTANLLSGSAGPAPEARPVTFILAGHRLVTVRYSQPSVFASFVRQTQRPEAGLKDAGGVLMALLEAVVDRTADILEQAGLEVDSLSRSIFDERAGDAGAARDHMQILRRIGRNADLNSKARESLVSIGRLVNFLNAECAPGYVGLRDRTVTIAADIRSLTDHASYVAGTIEFLLDATLGLINIEQNNIIRIVSVVSVLIMPPTLIASIYGMNFRHMPELHWLFGYPMALAMMVAAAVATVLYFKGRRWL